MITRLILVALVLAGLIGGIYAWKQESGRAMAAAQAGGPPPAVVAAAKVAPANWQPEIQVVGTLTAVSGIEVASEVSGHIRVIHFDSGDKVERGTQLLELDDQTDQAQLDGLLAERTLAQLKFNRAAKLIKDKSVSKSDYDEARATLDNAEARVAAQQALVDKKHIRAPFTGRLGIRRVDPGEYLVAGAPVVPLRQLDPIFVDFTLPEREMGRIGVGQKVELSVQAQPGKVYAGRIAAIDSGVEIGSRSFQVRAELANPAEELRPGMFADIRVLLPLQDDVLTIPDSAISYAPYGDSVFVIAEKDGKSVAERRPIETGATRDGFVEVRSGLNAGEQVVSAGHNKLRNGQAVEIDSKPAPAQRGTGA